MGGDQVEASRRRRYAYWHGFASSSRSRKGTWLARAFASAGFELELPDLNRPSFGALTYSAALAHADTLDARDDEPWCLIGSSLGGYLAARWAELHPARVTRLVLLCPGFGLPDRWSERLGAEAWKRWEATGSHPFPDVEGRTVPVSFGLIEDARTHPALPDVPCPTVIIHGRRDEVVPIESSRHYAATRFHVRLIEVDDDHGLAASLDTIRAVCWEHFGLD